MSDLNSEILLYLRQLTESEPEIIFDLPKPSESDDADSTPAKAFAPEQEERALRLPGTCQYRFGLRSLPVG